MPAFNRISLSEGTAIMNMFRMYDLNSTGIISEHYAKKLLSALGTSSNYQEGIFKESDHRSASKPTSLKVQCSITLIGLDDSAVDLSPTITSEDFLLLIDALVPPTNPPLTVSKLSFPINIEMMTVYCCTQIVSKLF
jgi:hypothetical protein